jgi:hypothetical protein
MRIIEHFLPPPALDVVTVGGRPPTFHVPENSTCLTSSAVVRVWGQAQCPHVSVTVNDWTGKSQDRGLRRANWPATTKPRPRRLTQIGNRLERSPGNAEDRRGLASGVLDLDKVYAGSAPDQNPSKSTILLRQGREFSESVKASVSVFRTGS